MNEKEFNQPKIDFVIVSEKVFYLNNSEMNPKDWLLASNIVDEAQFESIIKGFIKNNDICFYRGDFITDSEVENIALEYCIKIYKDNNLELPIKVYCGIENDELERQWKPKKLLKIINKGPGTLSNIPILTDEEIDKCIEKNDAIFRRLLDK